MKPTLTFFLLLIAMVGYSQTNYKIYDTKAKKIINIDDLVKSVNKTEVLFFGEEHNDSVAHVLQDTIYKSLINKYKKVTLSLEMFETDCQNVVNEYLNDFITESNLINEGRAWGNYKDYRTTVNTAKKYKQQVVAANAPRRYVSLVNRKGLGELAKLNELSKSYFAPLPIDTVNAPYYQKFIDLMGGQSHFSGNSMYYAQTLWDATMAYNINKSFLANKNIKLFHLNGRFHSDEKLGIITQLQKMNKAISIKNISAFAADDFENPDWNKYLVLGDFVILTNK
jgi:uncharacterized iron-regulated protein